MSPSISSERALERLKAGNERYVEGLLEGGSPSSPERRTELVSRQDPFAIILGCADSRVPAELVFDQGLGDLFVIRVAGNVVTPSQLGSVELAAKRFGTPLVVVLGHSNCSAVSVTLDEMCGDANYRSPNLRLIIDQIRPAIEVLLEEDPGIDRAELLRRGVRANIQASTVQLLQGSTVVEELVKAGELEICGAEYCLESGAVDFLDWQSGAIEEP
jgi:carbonic anhydrase